MSALHKGKAVAAHAIKAYTESGGTAPLIRNLGTRRRESGQIHAPTVISSGKKPPNTHLNLRLGVSQSQYGRFGEKKSLTLAGNQTMDRPVHSQYHMNIYHLFQHLKNT
jgi:hypothetical protein